MNRRNFAGCVLAALGSKFFSPGIGVAKSRHYFDWTTEIPFTTDPRYQGKLTRGFHQQVTVDGREVINPLRYFTGLEGWIEICEIDKNGQRLYQEDGTSPTEWMYGEVRYADTRVESALPSEEVVITGFRGRWLCKAPREKYYA